MCFIAKSCTASVSMSVPTSPVAQRSHARARLNSATPLHSPPAPANQSVEIQQVSFFFWPTMQVSCGIQQVSCGMRVALLILMAVKLLLSRTGCKITARYSHGVNRRSGTRACCGSLPARARPIVSHTTCARYPPATARGRALLEKVNPGGNHPLQSLTAKLARFLLRARPGV